MHELEHKVENLERQVLSMSNQINKYRYKLNIAAIGEEKHFGEYSEIQEFGRQNIIKKLEKGSDVSEIQKSVEEFAKIAGSTSNDRKKLLKAAFRVIIDNIVPNRVRVLLNLTSNTNEVNKENIIKLFKMNKEKFETEGNDPEYCDIDRLHCRMRLDPIVHYNIRK